MNTDKHRIYEQSRRIILYAFCAFLWLYALPSAAQAQPSVSVKIEADRDNIYCHETFELTLLIHSANLRLDKNMELLSLPDKNRLRLGNFKELPVTRRRQGNQIYEVRRFRCKAYAMEPGIIDISPELVVTILTRERHTFFMTNVRTPRKIRVEPLTLSINPLPELGKPADFSGAIGQFSFNVDVVPADVAVGDLITAVMKIHGSGYLDEISPPRISPGRHFKVYDPKLVLDKPSGEKAFEQIVIPQSTNAVEISAISFSFFNPRAGSYKTITSGPFPLTFHEKKSSSLQPYRPSPTPDESVGESGTKPARAGFLKRLVAAFSTRFSGGREAAVIRNETARLAPAHSAVASFDLTEGSVVRVLETYGNWAKISFGNKRGWMPRASFSHVKRDS